MKTKQVDNNWNEQYEAARKYVSPQEQYKRKMARVRRFQVGDGVRVGGGVVGTITALPCTHPDGSTGMPHDFFKIRMPTGEEISVAVDYVGPVEEECS